MSKVREIETERETEMDLFFRLGLYLDMLRYQAYYHEWHKCMKLFCQCFVMTKVLYLCRCVLEIKYEFFYQFGH